MVDEDLDTRPGNRRRVRTPSAPFGHIPEDHPDWKRLGVLLEDGRQRQSSRVPSVDVEQRIPLEEHYHLRTTSNSTSRPRGLSEEEKVF